MKTTLHYRIQYLLVLLLCGWQMNTLHAQTYTTVSNGLWNLASTWQGGNIPPATIASSATVNIKHIVTYVGGNITNNGTININNQLGVSPRLVVPSGVTLTNNASGKINIINAEYRQYRFVAGLELGVAQTGVFRNAGGYVQVTNSYVEIAQDWSNESSGVVVFKNSSVAMGRNYDLKSSGIDTIDNTSISVGLHGAGDFIADGARTYLQAARFQVASVAGRIRFKSGTINGTIDYITLKNHVLGTYSTDKIEFTSNIVTFGINLKAYCVANAANYLPNGKVIGAQTANCSLNYFPATIKSSSATTSLNFSTTPRLLSGTALRVGATYLYEGVTPGVDAVVKIDSLIGGATVAIIDDNTGGLGYIEGFQPEIRAGSGRGVSYAVFTISYQITGTSLPHKMNTFSITALDIDGNNTQKEFDQIDMGPGAVAAYKSTQTSIAITQVGASAYKGTNIDGRDVNGIDTSGLANMFTVSNSNVSSFTLKLGIDKTDASQPSRQFGIYMKGFVYPNLSTLPVKLEYFNASLNNSTSAVDLSWRTSSEKDVSHFSIEKSLDGQNFSSAGYVFAYGNSTRVIDYNFTDKNINTANAGVIYYRLRSVDIDGKSELSGIRMITINQNRQSFAITTYPNPVRNELRITIPGHWQGKKVTYEVFGNNGQVSKRTVAANATQTESIHISDLAPGFYIVAATCNGERAQQKIIKQ